MDRDRRGELRRWARRLREHSPTPDSSEAAARAIDLLLDEVERLEAEVAARDEAERARLERDARRAERERERMERGERPAEDEERRREAVAVAPPSATSPLPAPLPGRPGDGDERRAPRRPRPRPRETGSRPRRGGPPRGARALAAPLGRRFDAALPRPRLARLPRASRPGRRTLGLLGALLAVLAAVALAGRLAAPELASAGPDEGALVGAADAKTLEFAVTGDRETLTQARWTVDGRDATASARLAGGRSVLDGARLPEGEHTIEVTVPGRLPGFGASRTWRVALDRTPPEIVLDAESRESPPTVPFTVSGTVDAGARVRVDGVPARVRGGRFEARLPEPPGRPVTLVAVDRFGNRAEAALEVRLVPRQPRAPVRSVHVTFHAWTNPALRGAILRLVDEGRINSVELDLKDESGIVGFDADVPFGRTIGAVQKIYDLEGAIELLHGKGVQVLGRIVAFRDPVHAAAAWKRGWRSQVVQTPAGEPYAGYGGFTNFAHPVVRRYNIEVARRAAEAGIDDVLYDYIRRPDGPLATMRFPGLRTTPEASIASFLAEARRHLRPYGVFLGASVFGVAATRPLEVAQDIPAMARHADYIAPMLYPSHWGPGEYGVADPNAQPYEIVHDSLKDFQKAVAGTGARVVPWLQDFSLGVAYGPDEVRAQIRAARDVGIREWILWDAESTYTAEALEPQERLEPIATVRHPPRPPGPKQAGGT